MTPEAIHELVGRFRHRRIVIVGDAMLDEYLTGECSRLSPEAPIPVLRVHSVRHVPGGAANTAVNVRALGGDAVLVSAVGQDEAGRRLRDLVTELGVVPALVPEQRRTPRKVRALGGQQQLLRLDYEDDGAVSSDVIAAALEQFAKHVDGASVVVISDYAKGLVTADFSRELFRLAQAASVPVLVDPRPRNGHCYRGADYLTPNWKEAQALLGDVEGPVSQAAVESAGRRLVERFSSNILLTLGGHGMSFFPRDGGPSIHEAALAREIFDVSGAGDTVVAAFALAVAAGSDVRSAIRIANLAASIVVAKVGTATASAEELTRQADGNLRLLDGTALLERVQHLKRAGKRIVVAAGAFHSVDGVLVNRLQQAGRLGDQLIVLVRSATGRGGASHAANRATLMLGLRNVDCVCVVDETRQLLAAMQPDVFVDCDEDRESDGSSSR